jgi:uncharacterized cupin superfamily protein
MPPARPACILHWSEIEEADTPHYHGTDERMQFDTPFSRAFGLERLGIHHARLLPGRRTSYPHAESAEQEFVYVVEGTPDLWLDGVLHRLAPGDGVGFAAGTGQAHTFLNNTDAEVRLIVVGEPPKPENRIHYPMNPEQRPIRDDWWDDAPERVLGGHDGLPDLERARQAAKRDPGA